MEFETEFDYISPYSGSDSVSVEVPTDEPIEESLIIQTADGGEEENFSPDAIEIENNDIGSEVLFPEISSWESIENNNQVSDEEPVQNETLQASDQKNDETLSNIYKLLDERIPEKYQIEAESESESESETEITLKDIHDKVDNIAQFESEQLSIITEIRNNNIVSNNNSYYLDSFQIAITSAIFGSVLIGLLFRNIK